jgi:hypothetical protein
MDETWNSYGFPMKLVFLWPPIRIIFSDGGTATSHLRKKFRGLHDTGQEGYIVSVHVRRVVQ